MASSVVAPRHGGKALASLLGAAEHCRSMPPPPVKSPFVSLRTPPRTARVSRQTTAAVAAAAAAPTSSVGIPTPIRTDLNLIREPVHMIPVEEPADDEISPDLDHWIKYSVTEIVRNVGESPLLVHIYSDGTETGLPSKSDGLKLVTEKAVAENWPLIKGRWGGGGNCKAPNGIILVEELDTDKNGESPDLKEEGDPNSTNPDSGKLQCTGTKIWGLLIQGRGKGGGACYLLKTCRVRSSMGFCTHFCLTKMDSMAESAEIQLKKLWLQRRVGGGW